MVKRYRENQRRKSKRLVIVFLLLTSSIYSLSFETELSKNKVVKGEYFTYKIIFNDLYGKKPIITDIPENSGYFIYSNPVVRENEYKKDKKKKNDNFDVEFIFSVRALKQGYFDFGNISFMVGDREYTTENELLEIGVWSYGEIVVPPVVEWVVVGDDEVSQYENTSVYLVLRQNKKELVPKMITFSNAQRVFLEEVSIDMKPLKYIIGGVNFLDKPIAAYSFSTGKIGEVSLPRAKIRFSNFKDVYTSPKKIKVKSVESEILKSNAIGDFTVSLYAIPEDKKEGETFSVVLSIEGTGNFNNLKMPNIKTENLTLVDISEDDSWYFNGLSYTGVKSQVYTFLCDKKGEAFIEMEKYSWLSKDDKKIKTEEAKKINYKILDKETFNVKVNKMKFLLEDSTKIIKYNKALTYKNKQLIYFFIPSIVIFLASIIILIIKKRKTKKNIVLTLLVLTLFIGAKPVVTVDKNLLEAEKLFQDKNYQGALDKYVNSKKNYEQNPYLYYNIALCNDYLENRGEAIYYTRKALEIFPTNKKFRNYYDKLIKKYKIMYPINQYHRIEVNIIYILLIIFTNITAATFLLSSIFGKKKIFFVLTIVFLIFTSSLTTLFVLSFRDLKKEYVVISKDNTKMKKIPADDSKNIAIFPEGTIFSVKGKEIKNYYLVENGIKVSGWINTKDIVTEK